MRTKSSNGKDIKIISDPKEIERIINDSKWSVKGLKTFRGMEGSGFNANLFYGGKKVAEVDDAAQGGEYKFYWIKPEYEDHLYRFTSKFLFKDDDMSFPYNMDMVIFALVIKCESIKKYKSWCRKSICYRLVGDEDRQWRVIKGKFTREVKDQLVKKYGSRLESIMNENI